MMKWKEVTKCVFQSHRNILISFDGCESLYFTPRKQHMSTVFENRALRKVFASKKAEVREGLMELHSAELGDSYSSPILFG